MTVEAAIALSALVAVLGLVLATVGGVVLRIRCVDAAAEAARLAARGEPDRARATAARLLPAGAEVAVETDGDDVRARVRAPVLGAVLGGLRLGAEAVAAREPEVTGPSPGGATSPDGTPADAAGHGAAQGGPPQDAPAAPDGTTASDGTAAPDGRAPGRPP